MTEVKLRPCPFCGSRNLDLLIHGEFTVFEVDTTTKEETPDKNSKMWWGHVKCNSCNTEVYFDREDGSDSADECIDMNMQLWNGRKTGKVMVNIEPTITEDDDG